MTTRTSVLVLGVAAIALAVPSVVLGSPSADQRLGRIAPSAITDGPNLIFVHGWKASADMGVEFTDLVVPIANKYAGRVQMFEYYQDLFFKSGESCSGVQAEPSPHPSAGMPVPTRPGTNYCDSESDMAYNVVLLKGEVEARFSNSGDQPVVLMGNSMGAAIIRGLLSYSSDLNDGVAANKVDSVVFLEGAVDGASLARMAVEYGPVACMMSPLACTFLQSADKPAVRDFAAQSEWYTWANPGPERLPDVPTFNFFGDIYPMTCFAWKDKCRQVGDSVGDGNLPPGTNNPFDVPDGGARFLEDSLLLTQRYQWAMGPPIPVSAVSVNFFPTQPFEFVAQLPFHPAFHGNFETHLADIFVGDCADWYSPAPISVLNQIMLIVEGRLTGDPYECEPEPHG